MHLRASALEYRMRAVRFACAGCRGRSPDLRLEVAGGIGEFEFAQHHAGLGAVAPAEAVEDRGKMSLHRALLHVEAVGALLVEQAFGDPSPEERRLGKEG